MVNEQEDTKYREDSFLHLVFLPQIRLGEWDVHTDTEFHPNLEMDILSVR